MKKYAGADGILHFDIPVGITDKEVEIIVIYQSIETQTKPKFLKKMGWSPGFFEQTAGLQQMTQFKDILKVNTKNESRCLNE